MNVQQQFCSLVPQFANYIVVVLERSCRYKRLLLILDRSWWIAFPTQANQISSQTITFHNKLQIISLYSNQCTFGSQLKLDFITRACSTISVIHSSFQPVKDIKCSKATVYHSAHRTSTWFVRLGFGIYRLPLI